MNALLWGLAFILIGSGIVGNYHFADKSVLIRSLSLLFLFGAALACAAMTTHGKKLTRFAQESRNELRKVVWPTRQETTQMTGIVLAVTFVIGLFLWGVDAILLKVVAWLTGYGA